MNILGSDGISEPTPHISFLLACFSHTSVSPIIDVGPLIFDTVNHLVSFTPVSRFVLSSQENGVRERAEPADDNVHEHNPVAKGIPRYISFTVLQRR